MLHKRSQTLYNSVCVNVQNPQRQKGNSWLAGAEGGGKWEVNANGYRISLGDDNNVLELDSGDGA